MAVTQLDVLKIAVGMFAGAPSAKTTKMLAEWKGDARSLFATVGESVYAKQVSDYKGLDAKAAAALLVKNLGGDTLTAEVKGWATTYVERMLGEYKGNIGLVAFDAVNFLMNTENPAYAGVSAQLKNRLAVAEKYVASTQGSETDSFAILKEVTQDTATRDKAIESITGLDMSKAIKLTDKAGEDLAGKLTNGDDLIVAAECTLQTGDLIIDAHTTDKDVLKAVINESVAPTIRNIETIEVDFKGFGLSLDTHAMRDGSLKVSTSKQYNSTAEVTGLQTGNMQNLTLMADKKSITDLSLKGATGATASLVLEGQKLNITTDANIGAVALKSAGAENTVKLAGFAGANNTAIAISGDQNLNLSVDTTSVLAKASNKLAAGKMLNVTTQASGTANLSKLGSNVAITLNKASDTTASDLKVAKGVNVTLAAADASKGHTFKMAEKGALNLLVTDGSQEIKSDGINTVNLTVKTAGKDLTIAQVESTGDVGTDNIVVDAANKSVTFTAAKSLAKTLNVSTNAKTTFTDLESSGDAAKLGVATFELNKETTFTKANLVNKIVQFNVHADTTLTEFKGEAGAQWIFTGDKDINLGTGKSAAAVTLDFANTKGNVTIANLSDAAGATGLRVVGGEGKLTIATGSTGKDNITLGTGGGEVTLKGSTTSGGVVDGSASKVAVKLTGGSGSDVLIGSVGNDTITGGAGDTITGGAGKDVFHVAATTQITDFSAEDVLALTDEETSADDYDTVVNASPAGVIAGITLGAAAANKAHTELLQFGLDATDAGLFKLKAATTGFIGSDNGDFVLVQNSTAASSVQLGKGNDFVKASAASGQTVTFKFEANAKDNGTDIIVDFGTSGNKHTMDFSAFLGAGYKAMGKDGGIQAANVAKLGEQVLTADGAKNISGHVAVINADPLVLANSNGNMAAVALDAFKTGGAATVAADGKAVLVVASGTTANVFYVQNDGTAAITADEISLVGSVAMNEGIGNTTNISILGATVTP